ncbi:hypothetical protein M011DRAFT_472911, partial [Sporormia fimetaria CBS 119925]
MNSMAFRGGLSQPLEATLRSGKTIYRSRGYEHVIDQPMAKAEDQYRAPSPLHKLPLKPRDIIYNPAPFKSKQQAGYSNIILELLVGSCSTSAEM